MMCITLKAFNPRTEVHIETEILWFLSTVV